MSISQLTVAVSQLELVLQGDVVVYAGSTQKVKVSPGRSATAAQKVVQGGLGDEDSGTTVGKLSLSHPGV